LSRNNHSKNIQDRKTGQLRNGEIKQIFFHDALKFLSLKDVDGMDKQGIMESCQSPVIIGDLNSLCAEDNNQQVQTLMEEIIKSNLEVVTLSMLCEKPMSGHDIIRGIFSRYMVLLSQGTVYSLLYSLKKDGKVLSISNKGDLRTKKYICAGEKIKETQTRLIGFIDTMEYFLDSIKKELHVQKLPDRF